jgi:hypothetical protein
MDSPPTKACDKGTNDQGYGLRGTWELGIGPYGLANNQGSMIKEIMHNAWKYGQHACGHGPKFGGMHPILAQK